MSVTATTPGRPVPSQPAPQGTAGHASLTTARVTGLVYLGLALTGLLGYVIIRPELFTYETVAGLADQASLARLGIAAELGVVVTGALAAVWFYRLFRSVEPVAAGALAGFALANAVVVLGSAASLATALELALDPVGDPTGPVRLLIGLSGNLWGVGALFFGLWLVPMGLLVLRSEGMPRALGWLLAGGGIGYVLSAFVAYLAPTAEPVAAVLTVPASLGEFWMIGYLLHGGIFRR